MREKLTRPQRAMLEELGDKVGRMHCDPSYKPIARLHVHGGEKTIQWSACVCAGAGGVKVGHWIG